MTSSLTPSSSWIALLQGSSLAVLLVTSWRAVSLAKLVKVRGVELDVMGVLEVDGTVGSSLFEPACWVGSISFSADDSSLRADPSRRIEIFHRFGSNGR